MTKHGNNHKDLDQKSNKKEKHKALKVQTNPKSKIKEGRIVCKGECMKGRNIGY